MSERLNTEGYLHNENSLKSQLHLFSDIYDKSLSTIYKADFWEMATRKNPEIENKKLEVNPNSIEVKRNSFVLENDLYTKYNIMNMTYIKTSGRSK